MFVWLMVILKIPLIALLYIVYWSIKSSPNEEPEPVLDPRLDRPPHRPPPRHPRPPRRGGSHAAPQPPPPSRVRARARKLTPSHE
ncbi:MAG: hypothetical protein QOK25_2469 [Thermoleophilaceae bacterium]|nr:hypothetical protein [Thermoleophilaceae bacterium]